MIWFLSSLLFTTTPAAATAGDAEAGWKVAERNVYIDFDLETYPLEVSTDSHLGSNEQLIVTFYTAQGDYAGNVQVYFTSTHQYYLNYCSSSYTNFPTTLPTATDKVWRITVTRTSGTRVVVHCNEKEVLNILMSSSTCNYSGWSSTGSTMWSRDIAQIKFSSHKAADYYRAATACSSKPTIQDGNINPDTTIYSGEEYTVTCDDGFVVMGPSEITCQADGKLSEEPSCEPEMICDGDKMTLNLAEKGNFETIYLFEKGEGCEFPGDTQTIQIAVHECGTKVQVNNTHVIYSNQVTAVDSLEDSEIMRGRYLEVSFQCVYKRTGNTEYVSWEIPGQTVVESKIGEGSLTFLLQLYKSDEFSEKVEKEDYPYTLSLQDSLFMQVLVDTTDPDLSIGVIQLQAKDTPNENEGTSYDIIKDGCPRDSTLQIITTDKETEQALDSKKKRFSFQPFNFPRNQNSVYAHALVKVCGKDDDSCSNICEEAESRRRRSVGEKSDQHHDRYHVYQGPLVVTDPDKTNVVSGVEIGLKVECSCLTILLYLSQFL